MMMKRYSCTNSLAVSAALFGTLGATSVVRAQDAAAPAKDAPAAPAAAAPVPAPSAPAPADTGKVNSTHPARDGRGAGNLRDAIARQRAASERGRKNPAKSPAKSMRSSSKRGRR